MSARLSTPLGESFMPLLLERIGRRIGTAPEDDVLPSQERGEHTQTPERNL